ncbi:MAG: class I SAM-dependent methyltransferase [Gammaproteobacteria bacterium]|nr:class I SAM-dependent methyltransferase [Gammaproteobacteria bacterium]MDH5802525.1 class I SAM-dependent methyltransferase [Gammaproteobacteria bacterium]
MALWQRFFNNGIPLYLARHYWWAYLWRPGLWLFDHHFLINAILFGQYKVLKQHFLADIFSHVHNSQNEAHLLLANVYGSLVPDLAAKLAPVPLTLVDVAWQQLRMARQKTPPGSIQLVQMNGEQLGFDVSAFKTVMLFFLLHELPLPARQRVLSEVMRVTVKGGHIHIAEYSALARSHWFHSIWPMRWLLQTLEPFLESFWTESLSDLLQQCAQAHGKQLTLINSHRSFFGFYRVLAYEVR